MSDGHSGPLEDDFIRPFLTELLGGWLPGRYYLVVEAFDETGEPNLVQYHPRSLPSWDKIGLLRFALAGEENGVQANNDR